MKKFITKQNEKKNLAIDQTQKDIALFMENFCNQKREGLNGDLEEPKRAKTSRPGARAKKNNILAGEKTDGKFVRLPMFDEIQKLVAS